MKKIPLLEYYSGMGAEIGEFAGWLTPLWFTSNREEHLAVRSGSGVFDLTHMTRISVRGREAERLLQNILTTDVESLRPGKMRYALMCNEAGGIMDDLTVLRHPDDKESFIMVCNAVTHEKVLRHLEHHSVDVDVEICDLTAETALYAVQGPRSTDLMSRLTGLELGGMKWFTGVRLVLRGVEALLTRSGYTGENGYELMLRTWEPERLKEIWNDIVKLGALPCGLAARDSLRLEAGYPLYGQDMDENVNPVEARLDFAVDLTKRHFIGKKAIEDALSRGPPKRLLVNFKVAERGIPRRGYAIVDSGGRVIGETTSGGFSFTLGIGIGMGYVEPASAKEGEKAWLDVKGKRKEIEITLKPIVPHRMK